MELFYRKMGQGAPLIIVHGLYGASDNWVSIGRELGEYFEVYIIDQRNHGRSAHSDQHDYEHMKQDLLEFMDAREIYQAILLGHSMGGKTVMNFAMEYPERVSRLIVADIAPKKYDQAAKDEKTLNHFQVINALRDVDFSKMANRQDVDKELAKTITFDRVRQFLLKNVHRSKDGILSWSLNVDALYSNMDKIVDGFEIEEFKNGNGIVGFPSLFIRGGASDYILDSDFELIKTIFPYSDVETIPKTGHWLHAEQPDQFLKIINNFIFG